MYEEIVHSIWKKYFCESNIQTGTQIQHKDQQQAKII
jgi:hypothetical protein